MTPERLVVCAIQRLCDLGPLGFSEVLACGSGSDMVGSIEDILQRELSTCSEWSAQMGKTVRELTCTLLKHAIWQRFIAWSAGRG